MDREKLFLRTYMEKRFLRTWVERILISSVGLVSNILDGERPSNVLTVHGLKDIPSTGEER